MVRYVIVSKKKNFSYLHSNNCFYIGIIMGVGCNLVIYKNLKSAIKRAIKVQGYVLEVKNGQLISEGKIIEI